MLKSFLSTAAIALSLSLSPAIVFAELEPEPQVTTMSEEKQALIEELRVITKRDENAIQVLDLMISQMQEQANVMSQSLFGDEATPELNEVFNETFTRITDRMYELMQEQIDFVALQRDIDLQLYDEYFNEAELQDLIDFYQTPTGQKTAEIFPQLTQRSMELFGQQVTPTMIEIQQQVLMEEFAFSFGILEDDLIFETEESVENYGIPRDSDTNGDLR
ncbi:MAG: DUF2059 domain-containing protein [Limnothrix sp. RL_2_0]|nr:DUF2059 domain-containing protein [Limnothrix sp. RL_2_0]